MSLDNSLLLTINFLVIWRISYPLRLTRIYLLTVLRRTITKSTISPHLTCLLIVLFFKSTLFHAHQQNKSIKTLMISVKSCSSSCLLIKHSMRLCLLYSFSNIIGIRGCWRLGVSCFMLMILKPKGSMILIGGMRCLWRVCCIIML